MNVWKLPMEQRLRLAFQEINRARRSGVEDDRTWGLMWKIVLSALQELAPRIGKPFGLSGDDVEELVSLQAGHLVELTNELPTAEPVSYLRVCLSHRMIDLHRSEVARPRKSIDDVEGADSQSLADSGVLLAASMGCLADMIDLDDVHSGRSALAERMRAECGNPDSGPYLGLHECFALAALSVQGATGPEARRVRARRRVRYFAALRRATIAQLVQRKLPWKAEPEDDPTDLMQHVTSDWTAFLAQVESLPETSDSLTRITPELHAFLKSAVHDPASSDDSNRLAPAQAARQLQELMRRFHVDNVLDFRAFEERRMQIGLDTDGDPLPIHAGEQAKAASEGSGIRGERGDSPPRAARERAEGSWPKAWTPTIGVPRNLATSIQLLRNAETAELAQLEEMLLTVGTSDDSLRASVQDRYAQRHLRALERVDTIAISTRDDESLSVAERYGVLIAAATLYAQTKHQRKLREYLDGWTHGRSGGTDVDH